MESKLQKRINERRTYMTQNGNTRVPLYANLYDVKKQDSSNEVEKIVFEPFFNGNKPIEVAKSDVSLAILELNAILKILRMEFDFDGKVKYSELIDREFVSITRRNKNHFPITIKFFVKNACFFASLLKSCLTNKKLCVFFFKNFPGNLGTDRGIP